jgi:hypothetical protein
MQFTEDIKITQKVSLVSSGKLQDTLNGNNELSEKIELLMKILKNRKGGNT